MTSESQERMLAIVEPDGLDRVLEICGRWEVRASVIGRVTDGGALRILDEFDGEVLAEVPAASLHEDAPLYDRPRQAPDAPPGPSADDLDAPEDPGTELLELLADPAWVYRQYDHQLFLNTVVGPGDDATVLRLKHPGTGIDTGRGLALTTDGNHRWCAVDPRQGTAMLVAESVLNLACVGARPLAVVNCLNFGNPEHPEVMWQLSESVDGMGEACRALGVPVVGGNVSLYNESAGTDIDPTPVIGLLGMVDRLDRRPPGATLVDGHRLLLLGPEADGLGGSRWGASHGAPGGRLPDLDLAVVADVAELVRGLVSDGLVDGVHDVSSGGLGVALAEMAARSGVGVQVARVADHRALFGEAPGRIVIVVHPDWLVEVFARAEAAGVETSRIGLATGDRFTVKGLVDIGVDEVTAAFTDRLPEALGAGTASR
jgi:phosphoribosylformylglycinamidine synthase